jgi:hypothetical protein
MMEQSLDRASSRFESCRPINQVDYNALVSKLRLVAGGKSSLSQLSLREMRLAGSCLFDGERCLAQNDNFLNQYLDALRSLRSRMAIKRLIHAYCLHFDPKSRGIQRIGAFLREAISNVRGRWEWAERSREYMLFEPRQAAQQLANLTFGSTSPRAELERCGLTGQLLTGGLASHAFLSALNVIQARLEANPSLEDVNRAISWVSGQNGALYFSAHRAAFSNALLLPWVDREAPSDVRQRIQNYLFDALNDPRVDGGSWIGTEASARDVMIRWLAQATLEQFLKVVDRVAPKHQWDYRRAFWNAYIERRAVGNAWVAFGSRGTQIAKRLADDSGDALMRRFAILTGGSPDHAVLLLRIGDLVVADWSHNGRLRIWRRSNANAPELNKSSYVAAELRAESDFETVHLPPDGWQSKTEAHIRKHTSIRLSETEYMPRRRPQKR